MRGALLVLVACGGSSTNPNSDGPSGGDGQPTNTLSDRYPGDVGIGADPAVVWFEPFDASTIAMVTARYNQSQGQARMMLDSDHPAKSSGNSLRMTAGGAVSAVDLYKQLPDQNDVYVRWYVKYDAGVPWHHSGMWFGGYNPGMAFPSPMAGNRPAGNDRFSFSIEPVFDVGGANPRFDFYNYWMGMHSWMQTVTNDGTSYYGNTLIHQNSFTTDDGQWVCLEVHVKLDETIEVWKNDADVVRFTTTAPMGYWIRDKFCPTGSNGTECTDYPAPANEVLDLRVRSTTAYGVNAFWPQNYITDPQMGSLRFDQMIVATTRIGCLR